MKTKSGAAVTLGVAAADRKAALHALGVGVERKLRRLVFPVRRDEARHLGVRFIIPGGPLPTTVQ